MHPPALPDAPRRRGTWRLALSALLLTAVALSAQAQKGTADAFPSVKLPYGKRVELWFKYVNGTSVEEGLALGESVVADAQLPHEQVAYRARLAKHQIDHGRYARAKVLVQEASERAEAFAFRMLPDGGERGHWKMHALYHLESARCNLAMRAYLHADAAIFCAKTTEYSLRTVETARFTSRVLRDVQDDHVSALLLLADAQRVATRLDDARVTVEQALRLVQQGWAIPATEAYAHRVASRVHLDGGDYAAATSSAKGSIEVWDREQEPASYVRRLWGHGDLQNALAVAGRWKEARKDFEQVDAAVVGNRRAASASSNLMTRALVYARTGELSTLRSRIRDTLTSPQRLIADDAPQLARYRGLLAMANATAATSDQAAADAFRDLREAVVALVAPEHLSDFGTRRGVEQQVSRMILEEFIRQVVEKKQGAAADRSLAFQAAEVARNSSVQTAIQQAAVRVASARIGLEALVRVEQDLTNEERMLLDLLARSRSEQGVEQDGEVAQLRARLAPLREERRQVRARIAASFPEYERLVRPQSPTLEEIANALDASQAFVALYPTGDGVFAWAVRQNGAARALFLQVPAEELRSRVDSVRRSVTFDARDRLPAFAAADASWLYEQLIRPLQAHLDGTDQIVLAAAGPLAALPFAALPRAAPQSAGVPQWMGEQWAFAYVPTGSAFLDAARLAKRAPAPEPLLAWGDPDFGSASAGSTQQRSVRSLWKPDQMRGQSPVQLVRAIPALPETRQELEALARALGADASSLRFGASATRESVLSASSSGEMKRKRVLAFATHGLRAGDFPGLAQPALAMSVRNPQAERGSTLLQLEDVLGLNIGASWVVLSACDTAASDGRDAEALSGLSRGFLYAGAESVLATLWAVETHSAVAITTQTFQAYVASSSANKARSLQEAMRRVRHTPGWEHPAYWAPYVLIGGSGRSGS